MAVKKPRTRNLGTLTEAGFMGQLRSALRMKFRWWKPGLEAKRRAKVGKGRAARWRCAHCCGLFGAKSVKIDHVEPVGTLRCLDDLPGFVARLCPEDPAAFQVLCQECHDVKTKADNAALRAARESGE